MEITIRRASFDDLPAITEIYNDAILNSIATFDTEPKSLEDRRRWLTARGARHPVFVAERTTQILGWGSLNLWSERLAYAATVENSVYVRDEAQGQGAGKLLLAKLIDEAARTGVRNVLARISDGNQTSLALHRRFGFELVGVMRDVGFKFDRFIDVHLMQRLIDASEK